MEQLKAIKTDYSFYVERDDGMYDYKGGFKTYKEANHYRCECQWNWINHADYVYLREHTIYENGQEGYDHYCLTTMVNPEAFLKERGLSAII